MTLPARLGLRARLTFLVSATLVALLGGLGLLAGWQASERAMDTHTADRLALQEVLGGLVEQYVMTTAGDLLGHAGSTPWPVAGSTDRLGQVVSASLFIDAGAVLVDPLGRPLASWAAPGQTIPDAQDPGWAALRQSALAQRLPVSGVLTSGTVPMTAVGVPVPLADGGRGLLVGLSAARVSNLQAYSASLRTGRTGREWVVDGRGFAVTGPDEEAVSDRLPASLLREVLGGEDTGSAVYDDEDGTRQVVHWSRAGTTGWTALGKQEEEEFAGPLRSASQRAQALVGTLMVIAGTCVVVLHRKREAALERVAVRDDLTGLYNRRGWFSLADAELKRAARQGTERLLLFVDLDGLKQVNDNLGHREGDRALTSAARVLSAAARSGDLVGRLGGDEFVLLLQDAGGAAGGRARVLAALAEHNASSKAPFELRLSLGAEVWSPQIRPSLDELVRRADDGMYADKVGRPDRHEGVLRVPVTRDADVSTPA